MVWIPSSTTVQTPFTYWPNHAKFSWKKSRSFIFSIGRIHIFLLRVEFSHLVWNNDHILFISLLIYFFLFIYLYVYMFIHSFIITCSYCTNIWNKAAMWTRSAWRVPISISIKHEVDVDWRVVWLGFPPIHHDFDSEHRSFNPPYAITLPAHHTIHIPSYRHLAHHSIPPNLVFSVMFIAYLYRDPLYSF